MTLRDLMTGSDPELMLFCRKSLVSGCRRPKPRVLCTFELYKAVSCRRWHSRDRNDVTCAHVTESDPEVTSFDRKSPGSLCRRPKTGILGTFELLQGSNSQEVAVTRQEMMSCDPEVTSFNRSSPGSFCGRPKTGVLRTFHLQRHNSQEVAVT